MPVNSGDTLVIDVYNSEAAPEAVSIKWQQDFQSRSELYYMLTAYNKSQDDEAVVLFIQKAYYSNKNLKFNLAKIGTVEDESILVKLDDRFQYGQKNASGELRFVVYHDKNNHQYQHRFMDSALTAMSKKGVELLDKVPGFSGIANQGVDFAKNYVGDYLHTF